MVKKCFFAGHDKAYDSELKEQIYIEALRLYEKEGVKVFITGNFGGFDRCSASVIMKLKQKHSDIKAEMMLPYITKEFAENKEWYKNFDSIFIPDIPENVPYKAKIIKANQKMVDESDFLICYISHSFGGAYKTYEYAKKKKSMKIINFGTFEK